MTSMFDSRKLEDYLHRNPVHGLAPCDALQAKVRKVSKLGGGISNDVRLFSLTYTREEEEKSLNFVLRMYREDSGKGLREYQVLTFLEHLGFPVPHPHLFESDPGILGKPFIIMDKVEGRPMESYIRMLSEQEREEKTFGIVGRFAATLAWLHELRWENLDVELLHPPKDGYEYAERQSAMLKLILDYSKDMYHVRMKEDFSKAIDWLQANARLNSCERYSLVHGDYGPANMIVTDDRRIVVVDWEGVEVGDPAADVGYAYHFVRLIPGAKKAERGEELAEHFVSRYARSISRSMLPRLDFYKVAAATKLAVFFNVFSRLQTARRIFGAKGILLFPFIRMFIEPWREYLEDFMDEKTK